MDIFESEMDSDLAQIAKTPRKRVELKFEGDSLCLDSPVSRDIQNFVTPALASASSSRESVTSETNLHDSNNNRVSFLRLIESNSQLKTRSPLKEKILCQDRYDIINEALERVFDDSSHPSEHKGIHGWKEVVETSHSELLPSAVLPKDEAVATSTLGKRSNSKTVSSTFFNPSFTKTARYKVKSFSSKSQSVIAFEKEESSANEDSDGSPVVAAGFTRLFSPNHTQPSATDSVRDPARNISREGTDTRFGATEFDASVSTESVDAPSRSRRHSPDTYVSSDESVATASTSEVEEEKSLGDAATVLEGLERFVKDFRDLRIKRGYTQGQVSKLLAAINPNISQSTVSRFESLDLSFPNTIFLKPFFEIFKDKLEKECRLKKAVMDPKRGIWHDNLDEIDLPPAKTKRYKRALISSQMAKTLRKCFAANPRPSSEELQVIAEHCNLELRVVQGWFGNHRRDRKEIEKK